METNTTKIETARLKLRCAKRLPGFRDNVKNKYAILEEDNILIGIMFFKDNVNCTFCLYQFDCYDIELFEEIDLDKGCEYLEGFTNKPDNSFMIEIDKLHEVFVSVGGYKSYNFELNGDELIVSTITL